MAQNSSQAYYEKMYKALYKAAVEKNVPYPEVLARLGAAQTCLETGFGRSMVGNNAFGIKGKGPAGTVNAATKEFIGGQMVGMSQGFRAYNKVEDSAIDFVDFILKNKRYAKVVSATTVNDAIDAQGKSGYATDPGYASKLYSIHKNYGNIGKPDDVVTPQTEAPKISEAKTKVTIDKKGYVDKKEFYQFAVEKFRNSPLNGFTPHDGVKYKIDGSPESWAHFALRVATVESGFNVNTTNPSDPGGSYGLFQWGIHYGITRNNWRDPEAQLDAFINYAKIWTVQGGGFINPPSGVSAKRSGKWGGFAAVFSTIRDDKANSKYAYDTVNAIPKEPVKKPEPIKKVEPPIKSSMEEYYEAHKNDPVEEKKKKQTTWEWFKSLFK